MEKDLGMNNELTMKIEANLPMDIENQKLTDHVESKPRFQLVRKFQDRWKTPSALARKIFIIIGLLILTNVAVWIGAIFSFHDSPILMATGSLAYTLGLRHAVDADHLAAIDNVTRKLLQSNVHSATVGLFFSLGHSTIVIIVTTVIAITATAIQDKFGDFEAIGGIIGTSVSAAFLYIIAILNTIVFVTIYRSFRQLKRSGVYQEENIDDILSKGGLMARFFGPLYRFVDSSWKMFPLGIVFGFGLETSTEIGLLGITAVQANSGLEIWKIFFFPLLFTAGMALIDTLDGILMLGTYTWAYVNPIRKVYYNLVVTLLSILVAFIVGTIELLAIIGEKFELKGKFWEFFGALGEHFGIIGYLIIGLFILTFIMAKVYYRCAGYHMLEEKFDTRKNVKNDDEKQSSTIICE
ncbi:hypothetical protein G9A89_010721 [Geosiphon pyriformis]|nr:hypothetical protein G9A89_010721 [Geosiphon pyriformis]